MRRTHRPSLCRRGQYHAPPGICSIRRMGGGFADIEQAEQAERQRQREEIEAQGSGQGEPLADNFIDDYDLGVFPSGCLSYYAGGAYRRIEKARAPESESGRGRIRSLGERPCDQDGCQRSHAVPGAKRGVATAKPGGEEPGGFSFHRGEKTQPATRSPARQLFVIGLAVGRRMGRGRDDVLPGCPVAQVDLPAPLAAEWRLGIFQAGLDFCRSGTSSNWYLIRDHEGRGDLKESLVHA